MDKDINKGDVIEVILPSTEGDVVVIACVLDIIEILVNSGTLEMHYIMYGQNRLFRINSMQVRGYDYDEEGCPIEEVTIMSLCYEGVIADYVVIPDVDEELKALGE